MRESESRGSAATIRKSVDGLEVWSHDFPGVVRGIGIDDSMLYIGTLKGPVYAYRSPFPSAVAR